MNELNARETGLPAGLRPLIAIAFLALLGLSVVSCSPMRTQFAIIEGNYRFGRGEYGKSAAIYLGAAQGGEAGETIAYNIANAYKALGENESAFELYKKAQEAVDKGIRADAFFNSGCLAFELARYDEAYSQFRKALEERPEDADAKVNLELSLRMIKKPAQATKKTLNPSYDEMASRPGDEIFNIIRNEESSRWKSASSIREEGSYDDF